MGSCMCVTFQNYPFINLMFWNLHYEADSRKTRTILCIDLYLFSYILFNKKVVFLKCHVLIITISWFINTILWFFSVTKYGINV